MQGKRAMLIVTAGGWQEHYSATGVNGPVEDLLFPINHGMLFYPGFSVLRSEIIYQADKLSAEDFTQACDRLDHRLVNLFSEPPLPYRLQNGGDYHIPSMTLKTEYIPDSVSGFSLHLDNHRG